MKPVSPETGVQLAAFGKKVPVFVHTEACLEDARAKVRRAVVEAGKFGVRAAARFVQSRYPKVSRAGAFVRALIAHAQEQE